MSRNTIGKGENAYYLFLCYFYKLSLSGSLKILDCLVKCWLWSRCIFLTHFCKLEDLISDQLIPETPVPDYEDIATPENQSVFKFAEKFKTVLSSIHKIGILSVYHSCWTVWYYLIDGIWWGLCFPSKLIQVTNLLCNGTLNWSLIRSTLNLLTIH